MVHAVNTVFLAGLLGCVFAAECVGDCDDGSCQLQAHVIIENELESKATELLQRKAPQETAEGFAEHGSVMMQKNHVRAASSRNAALSEGDDGFERNVPKQCSAGSEVLELSASGTAQEDSDLTKVTLADYPSTGSSWLRHLLATIAVSQKAGNPSCAIYPEGDCHPDLAKNVSCFCEGFDAHPDAVLVKSHFPAQELWQSESINSDQYRSTMSYGKLLQLVRHPAAAIMSNIHRWGGSESLQSANLYCWGLWWERAKKEAGNASVMVLRYEDLCLHTAEKLHEVLQFLGGRFAEIELARINEILDDNPDLACLRDADELIGQTDHSSDSQLNVLFTDEDLMNSWGYRTDGSADLLMAQVERAGSGPARGKRWLSERNPWAEVWSVAGH